MKKQELAELSTSGFEKLKSLIEKDEKDKALSLIDEISDRVRVLETTFVGWVDLLLDFIADRLGEEAVYETMKVYDQYVRHFIGLELADPDAEKKVRRRAYASTMGHLEHIEIQEDEEKFIVKHHCTTGGWLRKRQQFAKTKQAHPWSHGEKDFCLYCTHCIVSFEMMCIEEFGYPVWVVTPEKAPDDTCAFVIYKNPKYIPEEYYRRIGMQKK